MAWTRLEPPPKRQRGNGKSEGIGLSLRKTRHGMVLRLSFGRGLSARLAEADKGWVLEGLVEVSLGSGADRGQLRLLPAENGDFALRKAPGAGAGGGLALRLPPHAAWSDEQARWHLAADKLTLRDDGVLIVELPEQALNQQAHAATAKRAA